MQEEEKSVFFPQEQFINQQKDRQKLPLSKQLEDYLKNLESESQYIDQVITSDVFSADSKVDNWEIASFAPGSLDKPCDVHSSWNKIVPQDCDKSLIIKNQIVRLRNEVHLLSLAVEIKICFLLVGDSTFWILSRSPNIRGPEVAICKFKKEMDSQRIFVIFGANIGRNNEFKFFKKQEIPEVFRNDEENSLDRVEMKIKFIDNGDDRVFLKAIMGKNRNVHMSCDKYIPCLSNSSVMLAGSGDSVFLKACTVKQIPRIKSKSIPTRFECCLIS
jgi:hypothetical protein